MDYWQKQTLDKPLYEDLLWARPENKQGAGKLLIVGGNVHGFAAVATAYASAERAGAGHIRLALPDVLRKTIGPLGPYQFTPSTPSGSFGRESTSELLASAAWADGVLLAGDMGKNSETAVLLESFVQKYTGQLTLAKDTVDYFFALPELVTSRPETTLVLSLAQLQKLGLALKFETPFLLGMGTLLLVQALHELTMRWPVIIITKESGNSIVAHQGRVSTTSEGIRQEASAMGQASQDTWHIDTAASASVFWIQDPGKPFEAITTSLIAAPAR